MTQSIELFDIFEGLDSADAKQKAEAKAAEFYSTPASAVRSLIEAKILPLDGPWLEPFAGSGAIIRAIPEVLEWSALELRESEQRGLRALTDVSRVWCPCDFFRDSGVRDWIQTIEPRVIISNPPNSRAFDAAKLLREWVPEAWLALCQPLSFGSGMGDRGLLNCNPGRLGWLLENTPDVYKLQDRPAFIDGRSGDREYAWFVWPPKPDHALGVLAAMRGNAFGWEPERLDHYNPGKWTRLEGVYRVLPPPGWKPSSQGVML